MRTYISYATKREREIRNGCSSYLGSSCKQLHSEVAPDVGKTLVLFPPPLLFLSFSCSFSLLPISHYCSILRLPLQYVSLTSRPSSVPTVLPSFTPSPPFLSFLSSPHSSSSQHHCPLQLITAKHLILYIPAPVFLRVMRGSGLSGGHGEVRGEKGERKGSFSGRRWERKCPLIELLY